MKLRLAGLAAGLLACLWLTALPETASPAGGDSSAPASRKMIIVLEQKDGAKVKARDPGHVFNPGDLIRFRFQPTFDGFLYVMNQSTSGQNALLFPKDETGRNNRIEHGHDYLIPATERGWFRIEGPPGFETVYFLVTPAELGTAAPYIPLPPPPPLPAAPADLMPRCDDEIFKARGDCVDLSAGPKALSESATLPGNFAQLPESTSRDLVVIRKPTSAVVAAASPLTGPAIYTFRIAHK